MPQENADKVSPQFGHSHPITTILGAVSNDKIAGQDVIHVHVHVIPRWTDDGIHFAPAREQFEPEKSAELAERLRSEQ